MKIRILGFCFISSFFVFLTAITFFNTGCGNNSTPTNPAPTATPTSTPTYTISGTVTYQPGGSTLIYVFLQYQGAAGPASIVGPMTSGSSYSFTNLVTPAEVGVSYDTHGSGLVICGNYVQETGCVGLTGSGDIVCIVGYTAACPASGNGTFYSTTSTVNIVFGGTTNSYAAGQSGTNCTE